MIKNLLISGCSFTEKPLWGDAWGEIAAKELGLKCLNVAKGAAGNDYIFNSIVDATCNFSPDDTMVVVMWSGIGRKDIRVSSEYWNILDYKFKTKTNFDEDKYYVFSGGMSNCWMDNSESDRLFRNLYKSSDPFTLCKDSLVNFLNLENFLKVKGFKYKFTSFMNCWNPTTQTTPIGDYSIGHFCKDNQLYKSFDFSDWLFVNENKDGFYEYTKNKNLISADGIHPNAIAHKQFSCEIIIPKIMELL